MLELTGVNGSAQQSGKTYKITFEQSDHVYVGCTCEELETRIQWHLTNTKSQVYTHRHKGPRISLVCSAPSQDKNSLEDVERIKAHRAVRRSAREQTPQQAKQPIGQKGEASSCNLTHARNKSATAIVNNSISPSILSILGCSSSGPDDLEISNFKSNCLTSTSLISKSPIGIHNNLLVADRRAHPGTQT